MPKIDPETAPPRYCALCGFRMSAYNETETCFRHLDADIDGKIRLIVMDVPAGTPSPATVITAVCKVYRLTPQMLASRDLRIRVRTARYVAMYLLYTDSRLSYEEIGYTFQRSWSAARYGYEYVKGSLRNSGKMNFLSRFRDIRALYNNVVRKETA